MHNNNPPDPYTETHATWNKLAELYQEKFMDIDLYNDTYDAMCAGLPKIKSTLLDLGCGPGNITRYLRTQRPDFQITGIDISPNMIALAQKNNPGATFFTLDCRDIHTLTTPFDGIICGFCLPYLNHNDAQKLIADCYSLLNTEGLLYISFVEGNADASEFQVAGSGDRTFFYFYNLNEIMNTLKQYHFDEVVTYNKSYTKENAASEMHTIVIVRKSTWKTCMCVDDIDQLTEQ